MTAAAAAVGQSQGLDGREGDEEEEILWRLSFMAKACQGLYYMLLAFFAVGFFLQICTNAADEPGRQSLLG